MKRTKTLLAVIWALVVVWPFLTVWLGDYLVSVIKSLPFWGLILLIPRIANSIISAIPFLILAIFAHRKLKKSDGPIFDGVVLAAVLLLGFSFCLWGYFYYFVLTTQTVGAPIGLGILLLFSPIYLSLLIPIGFYLGRWLSTRISSGAAS